MLGLSTALSGIRANRIALEVIAQNIANANTPGYHRQELMMAPRADVDLAGLLVGQGVELQRIRRIRDEIVEEAIRTNVQDRGYLQTLLSFSRRIETLLAPAEGSVDQLIDDFFLAFDQLSGRPDDMTLRRTVVDKAVMLSDAFRSISDQLRRFREITEVQLQGLAEQITRYGRELAELNVRIGAAELSGRPANNLRDRRDQLLEELSEIVDTRVIEQDKGQVLVMIGGYALVAEGTYNEFYVEFDGTQTRFRMGGIPEQIPVSGGQIAGLRYVHDTMLAETQADLDVLANALMQAVDGLHATGLGLGGSFKSLTSARPVADPSLPLAEAIRGFEVQDGDIYINIVNESTGERTLERVHVDPRTMSLNDLAAALAALPNITSVVNSATNQITIGATAGYRFDFTGRPPSQLDHSGVTGTATFTTSGVYTGDSNEVFTVQVVGSGEVGVTDGLSIRVTNSAGELVGEFNVGAGYVAGDPISLGDGLKLQVGAGTLNDGDSITVDAIGRPDTTGLLAALGLGSLFRGEGAASIQVRQEFLDGPGRLAAGRTGDPGDGIVARKLGGLREQRLLLDGSVSLSGYFVYKLSEIGAEIQELEGQAEHVDLLLEQLNFERQSISGVDIEEEVVKMSQYQRGFEAAARVIQVINDALEDLMAAI